MYNLRYYYISHRYAGNIYNSTTKGICTFHVGSHIPLHHSVKTSRIEQVMLPYMAQFQNSDIEVEQVHNMVDDKFVIGNQLVVYMTSNNALSFEHKPGHQTFSITSSR